MIHHMDVALRINIDAETQLVTLFSQEAGYLISQIWRGESLDAEAAIYWPCSDQCRERLNRTFQRLKGEFERVLGLSAWAVLIEAARLPPGALADRHALALRPNCNAL